MYYPEELVEDVRQRSDIVDIVGSYVRLTRRGANYVGLCPFHNEKTGSFSVNKNLQIFKCFGCGKAGNVLTFVMEYESMSFPEALKLLADRAGVSLPEAEPSEEEKRRRNFREKLLEVNKEAAKFFYMMLRSEQGATALKYFKNRGLSDEIMKSFGLGYAGRQSDGLYRYLKSKGYPDELLKQTGLVTLDERGAYDKFWNRAIFPIMDMNGKVIAFGGRIMGNAENAPKYLNSPETAIFEKGRNLYGLQLAKHSRRNCILLCEGYMDVIALHQAGFNNAVASLGTALTPYQAKLISRYVKEAVITYDSDGAGVKAALRAIPILKEAGIAVRILDMKPYKDPDEFIKVLGAEEYQKRIDEAKNAFYFEVEVLQSGFDMDNPEEKTRFDHELAARLAAIEDDMERDNYLAATAKRYNIDYNNLKRLMNRLGKEQYSAMVAKETRERERKQNASKTGPEEGVRKSQKLLLTWLGTAKESFEAVKGIITEDDFTDELFNRVAVMVFEQYRKEGAVTPARIINRFEDAAEQTAAAELFTTSLKEEEMNEAERRKAFYDTVVRVKENSINEQWKRAIEENDAVKLQELMKCRADLEKLHISR